MTTADELEAFLIDEGHGVVADDAPTWVRRLEDACSLIRTLEMGEDARPFEDVIAEWHDSKWGDKDDRVVAAKLAEECGEVCGALIKLAEDRRTLFDVKDELGDVLVVLSVLAGRHGWTLDDLRADRFESVARR